MNHLLSPISVAVLRQIIPPHIKQILCRPLLTVADRRQNQ